MASSLVVVSWQEHFPPVDIIWAANSLPNSSGAFPSITIPLERAYIVEANKSVIISGVFLYTCLALLNPCNSPIPIMFL